MIDIELLRSDRARVEENLGRRRNPALLRLVAEVFEEDVAWRATVQEADRVRAQRNTLGQRIAAARKAGETTDALLAESKALPEALKEVERREAELRRSRDQHLARIPNLLDPSVPYGRDDTENVVVATWGSRGTVGAAKRPHGEALEELGWADFERARRASGAGFYYLEGPLVLLDLSLQRFALDFLVERGFTPVVPPFMLRREPYEAVTDLNDFESVMYKVEGEDVYLIATSEHPLAALYQGEILDEEAVPIRLAGLSVNFRREIGGHGVDQKGLFRVHQFSKVEQFVFCRPEDSPKIHEELRETAEEIFRRLEIPYRVVNVCTGDVGTIAAKKYDIEAWFPRQQAYREVVSCSNCTDYQARSLGIRLGRAGRPGKVVPHTLNSTAIATSRALVAIVEQHLQEDGRLELPKVLRPYLGGREHLGPPRPRAHGAP